MNLALWIVQILMTLVFLASGVMKEIQSQQALAKSLPWTHDVPLGLVRFIGIAEVLGALGVSVPALTNTAPVLIPIAAIGLALIMVLALGFHLSRKEYRNIAPSIVFLLLAVFIIIGRFSLAPLSS